MPRLRLCDPPPGRGITGSIASPRSSAPRGAPSVGRCTRSRQRAKPKSRRLRASHCRSPHARLREPSCGWVRTWPALRAVRCTGPVSIFSALRPNVSLLCVLCICVMCCGRWKKRCTAVRSVQSLARVARNAVPISSPHAGYRLPPHTTIASLCCCAPHPASNLPRPQRAG